MMVELDFTKAKTREDVERVFEENKLALEKEIKDLEKLRKIFFEEK